MGKKIFLVVFLISAIFAKINSQQLDFKLQEHSFKLKESNINSLNKLNSASLYKKSGLPVSLYILGIIALISPMVVYEDSKTFFALTKEVSFGKLPFGRVSFEYSYVFRSYNTSHLRFSYNYDILLAAGDFIGVIASPGVGYFTDTKNKGWFLHASAGLLLPFGEYFTYSPYLRYRHTFTSDKMKSDIDDLSLGVAFILYF